MSLNAQRMHALNGPKDRQSEPTELFASLLAQIAHVAHPREQLKNDGLEERGFRVLVGN